MSSFSPKIPEEWPKDLCLWLSTIHRLSHALEQFGEVQLTVERQAWTESLCHEESLLQCPTVFAREIILSLNHEPVSYGRVAISARDWKSFAPSILILGERPIGETILHHDPSITRHPFQFSLSWQPPHKIAKKIGPSVARYSQFDTKNGPLVLTESLSDKLRRYPLT